jgi:hypothetical protein
VQIAAIPRSNPKRRADPLYDVMVVMTALAMKPPDGFARLGF